MVGSPVPYICMYAYIWYKYMHIYLDHTYVHTCCANLSTYAYVSYLGSHAAIRRSPGISDAVLRFIRYVQIFSMASRALAPLVRRSIVGARLQSRAMRGGSPPMPAFVRIPAPSEPVSGGGWELSISDVTTRMCSTYSVTFIAAPACRKPWLLVWRCMCPGARSRFRLPEHLNFWRYHVMVDGRRRFDHLVLLDQVHRRPTISEPCDLSRWIRWHRCPTPTSCLSNSIWLINMLFKFLYPVLTFTSM